MNYPTKDQLAQMRQQGMKSCEIAERTGNSQGTIEYLFRKYKLCRKRKPPAPEQIEEFRRMKQEGLTTKEIGEKTGYPEGTVYYHLKAAGQDSGEDFRQDLPVKFAVPRIPNIATVVYHGVRYEDVTELYIPS